MQNGGMVRGTLQFYVVFFFFLMKNSEIVLVPVGLSSEQIIASVYLEYQECKYTKKKTQKTVR